MEERILRFIAALRAAGVRISLAESADAFRAVDSLGIKDREAFRLSLQSTLVKDAANLPVFYELFPIFFGSGDSPPMTNLTDDLSPFEAQKLAEALRGFNENLRKMLQRLMKGEQLSEQDLKRLATMVGLNQADNMRFREWMVQRMKKALRFKEVQEALNELAELLQKLGMNKERVEQIRRLLYANQKALEDQLRQYAGQRIAENLRAILLEGKKPADIPMKPTVKGVPVINLAKAKALGINIDSDILLSAKVIQDYSWEKQ